MENEKQLGEDFVKDLDPKPEPDEREKWWRKFCSLPRFSFIKAGPHDAVTAWENKAGLWVEQHAVSELVDQMQDELNALRAAQGEQEGSPTAGRFDAWAVYDSFTSQVKMDPDNGALAIFEEEHQAARVAKSHPKCSYKQMELYRHPPEPAAFPSMSRLKEICTSFFYWWHNQPGSNTQQGFDEWVQDEDVKRLLSNSAEPAPAAVPDHPGVKAELTPERAIMRRRDESMKEFRDRLLREAEKAAHEYAASCDLGDERVAAFAVFENVRTAGRVY